MERLTTKFGEWKQKWVRGLRVAADNLGCFWAESTFCKIIILCDPGLQLTELIATYMLHFVSIRFVNR